LSLEFLPITKTGLCRECAKAGIEIEKVKKPSKVFHNNWH